MHAPVTPACLPWRRWQKGTYCTAHAQHPHNQHAHTPNMHAHTHNTCAQHAQHAHTQHARTHCTTHTLTPCMCSLLFCMQVAHHHTGIGTGQHVVTATASIFSLCFHGSCCSLCHNLGYRHGNNACMQHAWPRAASDRKQPNPFCAAAFSRAVKTILLFLFDQGTHQAAASSSGAAGNKVVHRTMATRFIWCMDACVRGLNLLSLKLQCLLQPTNEGLTQ